MALTSNQPIVDVKDFSRYKQKTAGGAVTFYRGSLCNFNVAGYVEIATDAAAKTFAGVALEGLVQTAAESDGDKSITLLPAHSGEVVELALAGVVIADLNSEVYIVDDSSVALTATNAVQVGIIVALSSNGEDKCLVKLI